jgi:transketolase
MDTNEPRAKSSLSRSELVGLAEIAHRVRRHILTMAAVKRVHIGPALSIVEILTVLYFHLLRNDPANSCWPDRDRFILSKGHGALALYGVLAEAGFISTDTLSEFGQPGNILAGHPVEGILGVEVGTGSLGHGLSVGAGLVLAAHLDNKTYKTIVLLGDGELDEGTIWEAALFASHWKLAGLIAIVDVNGYQQEGRTVEILSTSPLADKWSAFGWHVLTVDGHDLEALNSVLTRAFSHDGQPTVLLASTVKGKGVSYMENDSSWHMGWLTGEHLERALTTLEAEKSQW